MKKIIMRMVLGAVSLGTGLALTGCATTPQNMEQNTLADSNLAIPTGENVVQRQVLATVSFVQTGMMGNQVPPNTRSRAETEARKKALELYISECPPARRQLLERAKFALEADLDTVVPRLIVLNETIDKTRNVMEISAQAYLDLGRIDAIIAQMANQPATSVMSNEERPPLVFVFTARKIASITTSDGKKVVFEKTAKQSAESEKKSGTGGVSVEYSMEDMAVKEYGGKSIAKAQTVEYVIESVSSVDAAINEVFSQAGYECTDPADVEGFDLAAFRADYATGDDVTPKTQQGANALLKEYEVGYFAKGRMDITLPEVNEVSGLPQVFVKVEAKISDLRGKLPKTVASIAGEYFQGSGANVQVATQNALNTAAQRSAQALVDQLRVKGL